MDNTNTLRINVRFRADDEIEAEAIRIISSIPTRQKSHFIADAIVRANAMTASMENLPDEVIERLADAIAQKLSSSALSTKKKVGRPRKNRQEEPATATTAASVQKAKRGRPKGSRSLHTSKDNHSPSGHAQPDQPSQQQNTLVDSDLVNSMMDLVNNTISL